MYHCKNWFAQICILSNLFGSKAKHQISVKLNGLKEKEQMLIGPDPEGYRAKQHSDKVGRPSTGSTRAARHLNLTGGPHRSAARRGEAVSHRRIQIGRPRGSHVDARPAATTERGGVRAERRRGGTARRRELRSTPGDAVSTRRLGRAPHA